MNNYDVEYTFITSRELVQQHERAEVQTDVSIVGAENEVDAEKEFRELTRVLYPRGQRMILNIVSIKKRN